MIPTPQPPSSLFHYPTSIDASLLTRHTMQEQCLSFGMNPFIYHFRASRQPRFFQVCVTQNYNPLTAQYGAERAKPMLSRCYQHPPCCRDVTDLHAGWSQRFAVPARSEVRSDSKPSMFARRQNADLGFRRGAVRVAVVRVVVVRTLRMQSI